MVGKEHSSRKWKECSNLEYETKPLKVPCMCLCWRQQEFAKYPKLCTSLHFYIASNNFCIWILLASQLCVKTLQIYMILLGLISVLFLSCSVLQHGKEAHHIVPSNIYCHILCSFHFSLQPSDTRGRCCIVSCISTVYKTLLTHC